MNAVAAMCHFCEIHGPKIMFCTQPFHENVCQLQPDSATVPAEPADDNRTPSVSRDESAAFLGNNRSVNRPNKDFYGDYELIDQAIPLRRSEGEPSTEEKEGGVADVLDDVPESTRETCTACRSAEDSRPTFLTNDHKRRVSYVSSQFPYHAEIFSITRNACLRSLSCEVFPGQEGAIVFGDKERGYTLAHTFTLKDAKARGFQHLYSLVIVSMDRLLLINNYAFLVENLQQVIQDLQWRATLVYEKEQLECPEVALQKLTANKTSFTMPILRQRSRSGVAIRSLTQLTGVETIFAKLHKYFVWILNAGAERVKEVYLEAAPTMDDQTALELADVMNQLTPVPSATFSRSSNSNEAGANSAGPRNQSIFFVEPIIDQRPRPDLKTNPNFQQACLERLRLYWSQLSRFRIVACHVITGNQIIVQGSEPQLMRDVMEALEMLIPVGCVKGLYWANEYQHVGRYNLLALSDAACLPEYSSHSVLLKVEPQVSGQLPQISFVAEAPEPQPTVLGEFAQFVLNKDISSASLTDIFVEIKQRWLNKSKLLLQFTKQKEVVSESEKKQLMRILNCQPQDEIVLKFWISGLSKECRKFILNTCSGHDSD